MFERKPAMTLMNRKAFWAMLLALAIASAGTALWLFPRAMPLLQLNVSMSRDQALAAAEALKTQRFAELATTRAAARFDHDLNLQNYIELEGGGVDAFSALLGQRFVAPYHWTVRLFSESQEDELSVRFTPDGRAYGFTRKVPEKAPGAALTEGAARKLAESGARSLLDEALWTAYASQSASQITRPGGRIDHSFVYEHQTEKRGEARFRLRLVVAGDRLVEVTPYAFVPQAFAQRFAQLRSGNETIAKVANIALFALFGLGGLLGGWLWLARRGGLAWHAALRCAGVVGLLLAAAVLSNLPQSWFGYATTDSVSSFLFRHAAAAFGVAIGSTLLLGLIFAVAEGLSRRAFADQPRLFNFWSVAAGASPQAVGRTLGGYAWTGFELLLAVGFYLVARTQFGWWVPANSLMDPNILSAWRPALGPIAQALMAGTWEEALFRAVPLAGAALIGQWLGWRRSSIAVALVLQALVFAGGHAGYPGLPSYSRVLELFFPALVWGLIFLRFGLVPCIVMHFTFNLTLMSLPLFVATDSRLWLDRALVLLAGLLPLLMLARARFKQGYLAQMPQAMRNGEPEPEQVTAPMASNEPTLPPSQLVQTTTGWPWWLRRTPLAVAAVLGSLALWLWQAPQVSTQAFTVDHAGAIARAEAVLAERGVRLDADWKRLAVVSPVADNDSKAVRFVWREAGPQVFSRLLDGGQISPQHWRVMFRHATGPVEERSENWELALTGQGEVLAVFHQLPEGRPGAKLQREPAQALARAFMDRQKALANRPWELASVQEFERPARRDWIFRWDDKQALSVKGGSARVSINVRGDEIDAWQHVFVPDAWKREQQEAESAKAPFKIVAGIAGATLALLILGVALRQVVQGNLHWRQGLVWAALFLVTAMVDYALTFDRKAMMFKMAQDWNAQLTTGVALAAAGYLLGAALLGLLVMRLHSKKRPDNARVFGDLLRGLGLALVLNGVATGLNHFFPENNPGLPGVGAWDSIQPLWTTALRAPMVIYVALVIVALILSAVHFCHTRRRTVLLASLVTVLAVSSVLAAETLATGVTFSVVALMSVLMLWALVRRGEVGVAVAMVALEALANLPELLATPITNAAMHAALTCAVAVGLTWWALRYGRSLGRA